MNLFKKLAHIFIKGLFTILVLSPGIFLLLLGFSFSPEQQTIQLILIICGFLFTLLGIGMAYHRLTRPPPDPSQQSLNFDDRTVRMNQLGKLTFAQFFRLGLGTLIGNGFLIMVGGITIFAAFSRLATHQTLESITLKAIGSFLFLLIFGGGMAIVGLQKIIFFYQDLQKGIEHVTGRLSVHKDRIHNSTGYGKYRSTIRYRMKVHPHPRETIKTSPEVPLFPVGQDLYKRLRDQKESHLYTIHYLPRSKTVLSIEKKTDNPTT